MSKDILERVFEPFFTTKKAGKELALAWVKSMPSSNSRTGTLRSTANQARARPSKSTFRPCPKAPAWSQTAAREVARRRCRRDDPARRGRSRCSSLCGRILRDLQYRVLEAHDADSALGLIDRNDVRVDLLLTDLILPGMNGGQLAEEVKARRPEARVLFMTGYSPDCSH
jgi:hypothetical protein